MDGLDENLYQHGILDEIEDLSKDLVQTHSATLNTTAIPG